MAKKKKRRASQWIPPKNYHTYFDPSSDAEFKAKHPVGYVFLCLLGILALLLPAVLFCILVGFHSGWVMLGFWGGFIFGIGLFNFVAIMIHPYIGHWVSLICFALGSIIIWLSWLLC